MAAPAQREARVTEISRRLMLTGLGGMMLAGRPAFADLDAMEKAARAEGGLTWYIAQIDSETAERMGRAFTARYPGI